MREKLQNNSPANWYSAFKKDRTVNKKISKQKFSEKVHSDTSSSEVDF